MGGERLPWFCSGDLKTSQNADQSCYFAVCTMKETHTLILSLLHTHTPHCACQAQSTGYLGSKKRGRTKFNQAIDLRVCLKMEGKCVCARACVSSHSTPCQGPLLSETTLQVLLFKGLSAASVAAAGELSWFLRCGRTAIVTSSSNVLRDSVWVKLRLTRFNPSFAEYQRYNKTSRRGLHLQKSTLVS